MSRISNASSLHHNLLDLLLLVTSLVVSEELRTALHRSARRIRLVAVGLSIANRSTTVSALFVRVRGCPLLAIAAARHMELTKSVGCGQETHVSGEVGAAESGYLGFRVEFSPVRGAGLPGVDAWIGPRNWRPRSNYSQLIVEKY